MKTINISMLQYNNKWAWRLYVENEEREKKIIRFALMEVPLIKLFFPFSINREFQHTICVLEYKWTNHGKIKRQCCYSVFLCNRYYLPSRQIMWLMCALRYNDNNKWTIEVKCLKSVVLNGDVSSVSKFVWTKQAVYRLIAIHKFFSILSWCHIIFDSTYILYCNIIMISFN